MSTSREDRIAAQHDALDMFMFLRRNDAEFLAEETVNRRRIALQRAKVNAMLDAIQKTTEMIGRIGSRGETP